jgi:hypothetical protein
MRRPIGDILVEKGLITLAQLEAAIDEQKRTGMLLGEILIEHGAIDRLALASALGQQWNPLVRERAEQKRGESLVPRAGSAAELEELRDLIIDLQVKVARLEAALDDRDQRLALVTKLVLESAA